MGVSFEVDDRLAERFLELLAQAQMTVPEGQEAAFEKVKEATVAATISNIKELAHPTFFGYRLVNQDMESAKLRVVQRISKAVANNQKQKALEELKTAAEGLLAQVKVFQDGEERDEDLFRSMPSSPLTSATFPGTAEGGHLNSKRKRDREEEEVEAKFNELTEARKKWKRVARHPARESNTGERINLEEDVKPVTVKVERID